MKTRRAPAFAVILVGFLAPPANAAEPAPLKESRQEYHRALARAAAPLKAKYRARLNQLLSQYTKVGDLNAAVAIKKEIQALWLEGDWELTAEKTGKTEQVWFDANGICSYGTWTNQEGVVTTSANSGGWWLKFQLPRDGEETIRLVSYIGNKAAETWVMRRVDKN